MSGNEELMKAMSMFKEGISDYQTQQAVNDATRKVQALQQTQLDEKDRLIANQQIGQELALKMTAAGSQPAKIQAATEGLVPSASMESQNVATGDRQGKQLTHEAGQGDKNRASAEKIAGMRGNTKSAVGLRSFITGAQAAFDKQTAPAREMGAFAKIAEKALDPKNPILDSAVVNFMARSSGEKGPLTEADKAPFGGSQAFDAKAKQFVEKAKTGTLDDKNRAFLRQAVSVFGAMGNATIKDTRQRIAARSAKRAAVEGHDLTEEQIADMLMVEDTAAPKQSADKASRLKVWLDAPANAKSPRRSEAESALKKELEQQSKP